MSNHASIETIETIRLPGQVAAAVHKFLSECRTGNVTLNIKDGKILGAHVNEIISVKPAARPVAFNGAQRRKACPKRI